ncbi:hypothetical protein [Brevundimonas sp. TWP2-3-4b2]|uniref:hypothetical protein n=1 Tax=Brevundimonas sp. TWP2-3-4b2 TaxID=2804595 RepID=UPI003CF44EA7
MTDIAPETSATGKEPYASTSARLRVAWVKAMLLIEPGHLKGPLSQDQDPTGENAERKGEALRQAAHGRLRRRTGGRLAVTGFTL